MPSTDGVVEHSPMDSVVTASLTNKVDEVDGGTDLKEDIICLVC